MVDYDIGAYDAFGVVSPGFAEVIQIMPLITPYTLTDDDGAYYVLALIQLYTDAPGLSGPMASSAMCYYIAHLMYTQPGGDNITSEKLDDYSVTYSDAGGMSPYYIKYQSIISSYNHHAVISLTYDGVTHEDSDGVLWRSTSDDDI